MPQSDQSMEKFAMTIRETRVVTLLLLLSASLLSTRRTVMATSVTVFIECET